MSHNSMFGRLSVWIKDNYGSRRGFLRTWWHRFLCLFGKYRVNKNIDWGSVERLVFVCKGNICRSAYAEAIARSLGVEAVSCGLQTIVAVPANEGAIKAARARGVDLESHRTTPIMYMALKKTDLLVAMEPWHLAYMQKYLMRDHAYTLLGLWHRPVRPLIQDPYGFSLAYFDHCFNFIEKAVHGLSEKFKKPAG